MVSFTEAVGDAVRSLRCQVLGANAFVNGAIGLVAPGLVAAYDDQIARSRRLLGCDPAGDPTPPAPPFIGGQCEGVLYRATGDIPHDLQNCSTGQVFPQPRSVTTEIQWVGPIVSVTPVYSNPGQCGDRQFIMEVVHGGGQFTGNFGFTSNPINRLFNARFEGSFVDATGSPGPCGDPTPTYPPPTIINFNTDVTYNIDDGTEVTVNIPFTFSPIQINFDGSLRVPFTFDFGGFTFDGSFSLNPSIGITINPPRLNPGDGQGTETLPPSDPEDEVDPRPLSEKIIGVVVSSTIQSTSNLTTIATQSMPNIVAPRLGSIKFAYSLGLTTFWSNDIDIKGDRVFIPCPFSQGADAAVASPVPGVSLNFVEIKGFPLATTGDLRQLS